MDSTGSLWMSGALIGKAAGTFVSVGSQGGGQETVNLSMIPFLVHQGMVFVPLGFADKRMMSFDEVHGASGYGSGTFAGADGSRQPSDLEKSICEMHGKIFAKTAAKLAGEVQA
jgi:NAD(P)H dehydrogenase (quinone)